MCCVGIKVKISGTAFCIKSHRNGNGFNECGFTGAVFSDKKGYGLIEREAPRLFQVTDSGNIEWILTVREV